MYLPSTEVLKILGYNLSKQIVFTERKPEELLYVYVLVNAIEDVMIQRSDRKSSLIKCEAHNWFIGLGIDFRRVCEWALLDPEYVNDSYKISIEKKRIKFTHRQILWKHYHNTYLKMKKLSEKEKRRQKGTLTNLRYQVLESPTNYISTLCLSVI